MKLRAIWGIFLGLGTAISIASEPDNPFMWVWGVLFLGASSWMIWTGVKHGKQAR